MNDNLVDRAANGIGKTSIAEEGRTHVVLIAHGPCQILELHGRNARSYFVANGIKNIGCKTVGLTQIFQFPCIFDESALVFFHS